jgi:hypothetical protein
MTSGVKTKKLTATQFAKLIGVGDSAVFNAIKAGRFVKAISVDVSGRHLIDAEIGQVEWNQNKRRPSRNSDPEQKKIKFSAPEDLDSSSEGEESDSIIEHERRLKHYQAEIARLKFEEQSGKLMNGDAVKKQAFKVARSVRDAMLNIPARVSAELAAEKSPFEINRRLEEEIRYALSNLSEAIIGDGEELEELSPEAAL